MLQVEQHRRAQTRGCFEHRSLSGVQYGFATLLQLMVLQEAACLIEADTNAAR